VLREFPVPDAHLPAARRWLAGDRGGDVADARAAATVLLVRDGGDGVEVFLLRREASMAFAAGMYVFPGGGVDARDATDATPWAGPGPAAWAALLGAPEDQARALVCAAVRETFEECGVLLAGEDGGTGVAAVSDPAWETARRALVARETALSELLARHSLVLRSDLLRPWAHWTTPEHEPRRYDTRFLLAVLPTGQDARHVAGGESAESGWWPAAEVLDEFVAGRLALMPPTLVAIEEVAAAGSAERLWSAPRTVREVMPRLEHRGEDLVLVADLPDHPVAAR
jgi:8-oxo-dGTP pyrophosphatase MutT (NUDIX family)